MRFGFVLPGGDARAAVELAQEAEAAGWDGFFLPDCISIETEHHPPGPFYDPWVVLAAIAIRTSRLRFGTMLTALPRRRPWKLARELATLDLLSNGRVILSAGLGAAQDDAGFYKVGEPLDRRTRAELLEEGLEILDGLWRGRPFTYHGQHFQIQGMTLLPPPVQQPRIPLWVVGAWPHEKSMRRALRYDGLLPNKFNPDGSFGEVTPADLRAMRAFAALHRPDDTPFDIVVEGKTPGADRRQAAGIARQWEEAGATWWIEAMWEQPDPERLRERLRQGPPRL
jgi:alkanesulfonate monooxygenase SsuD/methylene tetrahydromethanopterin reductase-like flavin-dependent oxidoreductase (luciferase family)